MVIRRTPKWLNLFILILTIFLIDSTLAQKKQLTVEDIFTRIRPQLYKGLPSAFQWLPSGKKFSYIKTNKETRARELWVQEARNGKEKLVVSSTDLVFISPQNDTIKVYPNRYEWFPDEKKLMFVSSGDVWTYNLTTKKLKRITATEAEESEVHISPDGKWISFVRDFNLFAVSVPNGKEIQLTSDGKKNQILNGKLDWVYQEELVGRGKFKAYWWSPDSRHIAYLQFNENPVPEYPLVDWIPYHPNLNKMRYPKAGDPNPIVKIGVVPMQENPSTTWMDTGENTDVYFPRVYWLPNSQQLAFMRLDRHQQHLEFLFADISTGKSHKILEESDPYWINIGDFVHFFKKKPLFIWGSERSGYRHLYLYDYQGNLIRQLTSGKWMVETLNGVDEKHGWVYFTATEKDILERHIYRVNLKGEKFKRLTLTEGTHSARFSPNQSYFLDYYSHLNRPYTAILYRNNGKKLRTISKPVKILEKYQLQLPELFTFKGDNGIVYQASMIKPPRFDPHKKYPVLIYVYGGPHAQVIRKAFGGTRQLWHEMLAEKGYIIFSMDNRGAWGRGHDWEKVIYKHMGKTELSDQLQGVKYLKSLPYVDSTRIGIWGWSYGGYMTLYSLTHSKAFRTGVSVAPVTDWRDYDTIYTERYMSLPQDNPDGYRDSSPVFAADSLHGKLFLVHGTGDDNVHMQNSIQMIDRLIDAGKQFNLMLYPNQKHGISAPADHLHLFKMITRFLDENLKGEGE